jgi:hypothetical protein
MIYIPSFIWFRNSKLIGGGDTQTGWRSHKPTLVKWAKMDFRELGCAGVDWIPLSQDRVQWRAHVNAVVILWIP